MSWLFAENLDTFMLVAARDPERPTELDALIVYEDEPWTVEADPTTSYDRPLAVLTGPKTSSAGEVLAYALQHHPTARHFGRATGGGFSSTRTLWNPDPYIGAVQAAYTEHVYLDPDLNSLQGSEQVPDVEVWFTAEDAAEGRDPVIQAALAWIDAET